jgi:hypothetical protein
MLDDQTANKTVKPLMKGKKKSLVQEQCNYSLSCSCVTPLASCLVCLCLLGRFGAVVWWCWSPPVVGGRWAGPRWACGVEAWWGSRQVADRAVAWQAGMPMGLRPGGAEAWQSCGLLGLRSRGLVGLRGQGPVLSRGLVGLQGGASACSGLAVLFSKS